MSRIDDGPGCGDGTPTCLKYFGLDVLGNCNDLGRFPDGTTLSAVAVADVLLRDGYRSSHSMGSGIGIGTSWSISSNNSWHLS